MTDITILGLGSMGYVLAELMLKADKSVTVWNRTPSKAAPLVAAGAELAQTPAEAIAASPASIIILYDSAATSAVLASEGCAEAINGKLLIDLGTAGPDDVRATDALISRNGGRYLDGAIQAAPSQMGAEDALILLAGPLAMCDEAQPLLAILGGITHLGERIDAAAFMDLATLSYVYGAFAGFLHGARIAESVGIDVGQFGAIVNRMSPSFGAFFMHEASVIQSGDFAISESPLRISTSATERILRTSQNLGLNDAVPALVNRWLLKAESAGFADEEVAAVIKVLRGTDPR